MTILRERGSVALVFLKNYTSAVPVHQTIHAIEQVLIRCGVSGISKEYTGTNGQLVAITFKIQPDPTGPAMTVRLPVDAERALDALWLNYAGGEKLTEDGKRLAWNNRKKLMKQDFQQQAERTAWKIVRDWIEVQMSMIQMQQADFREVFLPYVWDGKQTFFQAVRANGFRAMLPEKCET